MQALYEAERLDDRNIQELGENINFLFLQARRSNFAKKLLIALVKRTLAN